MHLDPLNALAPNPVETLLHVQSRLVPRSRVVGSKRDTKRHVNAKKKKPKD